jgi:hypothetical protein
MATHEIQNAVDKQSLTATDVIFFFVDAAGF